MMKKSCAVNSQPRPNLSWGENKNNSYSNLTSLTYGLSHEFLYWSMSNHKYTNDESTFINKLVFLRVSKLTNKIPHFFNIMSLQNVGNCSFPEIFLFFFLSELSWLPGKDTGVICYLFQFWIQNCPSLAVSQS